MDLDDTFLWITVASCVLVLVRSLPLLRQRQISGWAVVSAIILLVAGAGMLFFRAWAGVAAGSLWALFILLPTYLMRAATRCALGQRYRAALRLARVIRWLHPADGWREQPEFYRALAFSQAGQTDRAIALFDGLLSRPHLPAATEQALRVERFRLLGRWDEFLAWIKGRGERDGSTSLDEASSLRVGLASLNSNLLPACLRALGETGRLREMIAAFRKESTRPGVRAESILGISSRLTLFAFGGRPAAVAALCEGSMAGLPGEAKSFWLCTAQMAAGQPEAARAALRELTARSSNPDFRRAVDRRLNHDLCDASQVLSPAEQEALDQIETRAVRDQVFHPQAAGGLRRAYATLILIALNLGMFSLEVTGGGSENIKTFYRLGGMFPSAVLGEGQWYRLLAALFLHAGPVHLGMNLLALAFIGPWVEKRLGRVRYLAVYLLAGVGSSAAVLLFMRLGWTNYAVLVGASGAIMGLIGATGALLAVGWRRERSALAAQRLRGVGLIVALQVVFDVMTPQVSFAAHASGIVLGFLLTALLGGFRFAPGGD